MGSGLVTAGDEEGLLRGDRLQGLGARFHPLDPGRVGRRAHDDEVVVHQGDPLRPEAVGDELLLQGLGVDHDQVDVALLGDLQGRAGAGAHVADPDAGLLFERVFQGPDDARVDGADGAGHEDKAAFCAQQRPGTRNRKLTSTGNSHFFIFPLLQMFE